VNKAALVIGGIAVAIIAVVLWVVIKNAGSDLPAGSSSASPNPTSKMVADRDQSTSHVSPALPGSTAPQLGSATSDLANQYTTECGVHVRDHRDGSAQRAPDVPPNIHTENSRKIPPELTQAISQQVKAVMMQCVRDLPRDARGAGPRLEGQLVVGVKAGKLSITSTSMQLRDIVGAAAETTRQCIEQRSVGLSAASPDQADLDGYTINISFAIP
jgi:hypothetical protein